MLISVRRAGMPELLTKRQYQTLLWDLRRIIGGGKEEAERAAAQALIELGPQAETGLRPYLTDGSPAPVWGSEEVAEYETHRYRR